MRANAWFLYNLLHSTKHLWSLKKVQQFSQYLAGMLRVSQHQFRSCCRFKARVPSMDLHDLYTKSSREKIASRWSGYFRYSQNLVYFFEWLLHRIVAVHKKYMEGFHPPDLSQHRWFYERFPLWSPTPKWIEMESSRLEQAGNTWVGHFTNTLAWGPKSSWKMRWKRLNWFHSFRGNKAQDLLQIELI